MCWCHVQMKFEWSESKVSCFTSDILRSLSTLIHLNANSTTSSTRSWIRVLVAVVTKLRLCPSGSSTRATTWRIQKKQYICTICNWSHFLRVKKYWVVFIILSIGEITNFLIWRKGLKKFLPVCTSATSTGQPPELFRRDGGRSGSCPSKFSGGVSTGQSTKMISLGMFRDETCLLPQ